jgi:hypothetical protein
MTQAVLQSETNPVLYVAFELSRATWKMAMGVGDTKARFVTVPARDLRAVEDAVDNGGVATARQCFCEFGPRIDKIRNSRTRPRIELVTATRAESEGRSPHAGPANNAL